MEYKEFEGKSVDEAIVIAMKTLRASFEDLDIQIISEGSKGLFGLVGTKTAKILAKPIQDTPPAKPEPPQRQHHTRTAPPAEMDAAAEEAPVVTAASQEVLEKARETTAEILRRMRLPTDIRLLADQTLEIVGDGSGLIIGKRGQTLDALQFIVNRIVNKNREVPSYVTLDTEGYRDRHMKHLRSMAVKMGQKAKRTGQSVSLERMNPHDRRIVHLALKNDTRINTKSVGEGVYKKVVIVPRKA